MTGFTRLFLILPLLLAAMAGASVASPERFAGEASIGAQPAFPIHLELRRSDGSVTGTVSIPGTSFELVDAKGDGTIAGRFQGPGGSGGLTLHVDGDALTGEFDLAGQPGKITARRTLDDAATFFRPPEQRLDLTDAQWLQDLDRLEQILTRDHASPYHKVSADRLKREVERVRGAIPDLDGVGVALEFRKLAALIGDGHTSVDLPKATRPLPVGFFMFEDGLRLVRAPPTHRDLLGAKLTSVNGVPVGRLVEAMRPYVPQGETEWHNRDRLPGLVGNPDILRAAAGSEGASFAFGFETESGPRQVEVIAMETVETALLGGDEPLWRRKEAEPFWSEKLADGSVYVNWRAYDGLAEKSAALLRELDAQHPRRLIIDLRDNDGGDFTIGRAFVEAIESRPWLNRPGVLYVLIGRKTFSAAMTNAVDLEQTMEAVLVGEPAGAAPNNWQEVRRFHLPNSGLRVGVSTRYYEFLPGKTELRPDTLVPPVPGDWGSAEDAAVRFILAQPVP